MFPCRCLLYCLVFFLLLLSANRTFALGVQTQADCESALSNRHGHDEICNNHRTYEEQKRFPNHFSSISRGLQTLQSLETADQFYKIRMEFLAQTGAEATEELDARFMEKFYPDVLNAFQAVKPVPALQNILRMYSVMIPEEQAILALAYIAGQDQLAPEFDSQAVAALWRQWIGRRCLNY